MKLFFIQLFVNHILEILSLLFSIVALIFSSVLVAKGWWKNRNIYDVELLEMFSDDINKYKNMEISKKLNSGKYTILYTEKINYSNSAYNTTTLGPTYHILLGRIKK